MGISEEVISSILEVKYTSPDGTLNNVFNHEKGSTTYRCVLCSVTCSNDFCLIQHAYGNKHQRIIDLVDVEFSRDNKTIDTPQQESKSENDPPINQDKVKTSKLQLEIDKTRSVAIIGLEYIIEVQSASNSETYGCILCQCIFDQISNVISHLTGYQHRLKYCENHFPTVFGEINYLTQTVCEAIEEKFGRLSLLLVEENEFRENKHKFTDIIMNIKHINESMGSIDLLQKLIKKEDDGCTPGGVPLIVDTISISSESSSENDIRKSVDGSSSTSSGSSTTSNSNSTSNSIHLEQQEDIHLEQQEDKMKSFRLQMATATKELKAAYLTYACNPYTYPGYNEKWSVFWNTRYKEFRSSNMANETYNWTLAWSSEWNKILKESLQKEIEMKSSELKQKLGIVDSELVENEQVKTQPSMETTGDIKKGDVEQADVSKIKLCTTLRGPSASTSHSSRRASSRRRSNSRRRSKSRRRSNSPRKSHPRRGSYSRRRSNSPRSRSPRNRRRKSNSKTSRSSRRSYSPRRLSQSQKIESHRRSRSPLNKSSKQTLQKSEPRLPRKQEQVHQKEISSSGKCQASLRLEQLLERHKHDSDFLISWRDLLNILQIEDNKSKPVHDHAVGGYSRDKTTTHKQSNERSNEVEQEKSRIVNDHAINRCSSEKVPTCTELNVWSKGVKLEPSRIVNDDSAVKTATSMELNGRSKEVQQEPVKTSYYPSEHLIDSEINTYVDKSVTIVSVLSYLTALKDLLGPTLGPKLMNLMHKATSMDKSSPNSSDALLVDEDSYILFETIKEKLRGLLSTGQVEVIQNPVKRAIKNMTYLLRQATEREKIVKSTPTQNFEEKQPEKQITPSHNGTFRQDINFEKVTSPMPLSNEVDSEEICDIPIDASTYDDTTLTDSELKILIAKYAILSESEKKDFIDYMTRLESISPDRINRLRNEVVNIETQSDLNENSFEMTIVISDDEEHS